ncbi:MAG TPA: hypothetical protein DCX27_17985, partial [Balneola sp.]|nr:hypothetical protein [Balneola sp.]
YKEDTMKPLKLTGNDVQLIISSVNQTIDQWLKWAGAEKLPDGFDDIDAINVVRELADLLYRVEDYQIALEEQVELEDDFPDNVIKFKKDE